MLPPFLARRLYNFATALSFMVQSEMMVKLMMKAADFVHRAVLLGPC